MLVLVLKSTLMGYKTRISKLSEVFHEALELLELIVGRRSNKNVLSKTSYENIM